MTQANCEYRTPEGRQCTRSVRAEEAFCPLHYGSNWKPGDEFAKNPDFEAAFAEVVAASNGDWQGFVFPPGTKLPKEIRFPVNARWSTLVSLELEGSVFWAPVDFRDAASMGRLVLRSVVFEEAVTFDRFNFNGPVDFMNVQCRKNASFHRTEFAGRSILRINFNGRANFNEAVFREGAIFSGWRNVSIQLSSALLSFGGLTATISGGRAPSLRERIRGAVQYVRASTRAVAIRCQKAITLVARAMSERFRALRRRFSTVDPNTELFRVFEKEGQLQGVVFLKPDQTVFSEVDLSRVYFRGTNLRGVRFLGVNWRQKGLGRNGLYDEIFIRLAADGPFRFQYLPVLEETCRNARVALEENRSFAVASDFYIGEMEAIRAQLPFVQRHVFSVPALYRAVSNYGTSVGAALRILLELYLLHLGASLLLDATIFSSPAQCSEVAVRSLKVIVFQSPDGTGLRQSVAQAWCDTLLRILGPAQIAMLVLAFRARIKRH